MKTEELTALGLTEEQVKGVFALNGKDIAAEQAKHSKAIAAVETERDDLKTRLATAETTLKGFEGIDPAKVKQEIEDYKKRAEDAEKGYTAKITARDQQDWINTKLDEYGVKSPYARKQLAAECMSEESGLTWKDGAFFGFDDFMKAAKAKDADLYQTAEEKAAADEAAKKAAEAAAAAQKAPKFTGAAGEAAPSGEKFTPPKIF